MWGRFVETRPDDGEKYAGWYGGAFASCKNVFSGFCWSKMLKIVEFHYIFVDVGMSRGPTSEVEKIENVRIFQKLIKLHEMTGNDQKSVWEHRLCVGKLMFNDLGRPGRSSGIIERDFDVDSYNSKVTCFLKVSKSHEMIGHYQKRVWEHHLGVGTINFDDLFWRP